MRDSVIRKGIGDPKGNHGPPLPFQDIFKFTKVT